MFLLTVQGLLHMPQTDCGFWVDTVLDLKEQRQAILQKSFIVPLTSTAAMMRSRGCFIALTERGGEIINSLLQYQTLKWNMQYVKNQ